MRFLFLLLCSMFLSADTKKQETKTNNIKKKQEKVDNKNNNPSSYKFENTTTSKSETLIKTKPKSNIFNFKIFRTKKKADNKLKEQKTNSESSESKSTEVFYDEKGNKHTRIITKKATKSTSYFNSYYLDAKWIVGFNPLGIGMNFVGSNYHDELVGRLNFQHAHTQSHHAYTSISYDFLLSMFANVHSRVDLFFLNKDSALGVYVLGRYNYLPVSYKHKDSKTNCELSLGGLGAFVGLSYTQFVDIDQFGVAFGYNFYSGSLVVNQAIFESGALSGKGESSFFDYSQFEIVLFANFMIMEDIYFSTTIEINILNSLKFVLNETLTSECSKYDPDLPLNLRAKTVSISCGISKAI